MERKEEHLIWIGDLNVKVGSDEQGMLESLADAKVSLRQHCVYEGPSKEIYSKSTICDFLLMVNSNCGHITYRLRDIFGCRG